MKLASKPLLIYLCPSINVKILFESEFERDAELPVPAHDQIDYKFPWNPPKCKRHNTNDNFKPPHFSQTWHSIFLTISIFFLQFWQDLSRVSTFTIFHITSNIRYPSSVTSISHRLSKSFISSLISRRGSADWLKQGQPY